MNSLHDTNSSTGSHTYSFALDPNRSILPASPRRSSPRVYRQPKDRSSAKHPLANDTTDVFHDSEFDDEYDSQYEWGMTYDCQAKHMRLPNLTSHSHLIGLRHHGRDGSLIVEVNSSKLAEINGIQKFVYMLPQHHMRWVVKSALDT